MQKVPFWSFRHTYNKEVNEWSASEKVLPHKYPADVQEHHEVNIPSRVISRYNQIYYLFQEVTI